MKIAHCPSCGAAVGFRSAASIYAVCDYCRATLLRDGESLKNLGRMADLLDDPSLIQLGSEGRFRGLHFMVIGRIQLTYDGGFWNEWHVLFDDANTGWLSEAGGEYVVSRQVTVSEALPSFAALAPEMRVTIAGNGYTVTDLETARCIAGQGELPFKVQAGYAVDTADLRGQGRCVTIDYSEAPPLVFVGYPARVDELEWSNLRGPPRAAPSIQALAFNCPRCGAALSVHSGAIESVACGSCGSIVGIDNEKVQLLARATQAMRVVPWLPLGSQGTLHGIEWAAIGFLRRRTRSAGVNYSWSEYLLFNAQQGFAWLTEYQGHWNFVRTLPHPPVVARGQKEFKRLRHRFRLFSSGPAEVTYVLGEFYWRVAVGESCLVEDYICPPVMLSREVTDQEVTWSEGLYLEPEALCAAFRTEASPPARIGVFANQPNPLVARHRTILQLYLVLAMAATLVQLLFFLLSPAQVELRQTLLLSPFAQETTLTTQAFTLPAGARSLGVTHGTDIDNNWVDLTTTLVDRNAGVVQEGAQTVSYYHGVEAGEGWSEGSREDTLTFRTVPPGTYYLAIEYELGTDRQDAVNDRVEIVRNPVSWSNYVLVVLSLLVFPLVSRWQRNRFEARRWSDSDQGEDDEDA